MNSLPAADRGAGGGMNQTFQNSAQVLSIGIFFTLMILGLAVDACRTRMTAACEAHGVPRRDRARGRPPAAGLDPVRRLPRLQPDPAPAGPARARRARPHNHAALAGPLLLPAPDLGAVPERPARGVRVRHHRLPGGRRGVAHARRPAPGRDAGACPLAGAARPGAGVRGSLASLFLILLAQAGPRLRDLGPLFGSRPGGRRGGQSGDHVAGILLQVGQLAADPEAVVGRGVGNGSPAPPSSAVAGPAWSKAPAGRRGRAAGGW